jgi:hypothetical protein
MTLTLPKLPKLKPIRGLPDENPLGIWALVRSAFFSTRPFVGVDARPEITEPLALHGVDGYEGIVQTSGQRLNQDDADVFYWLLAKAYFTRNPPLANVAIEFTREEAMRALNRSRGTNNFKALDDSLNRMVDAWFSYDMTGRKCRVRGRTNLLAAVEAVEKDKGKGHLYRVFINPKVAELLEKGHAYTRLTDTRFRLKSPLARALHAFFASQYTSRPYPMTTDLLKKLTDRNELPGRRKAQQESKWLENLKDALAKVKDETGWPICELISESDPNPKWAGKVVVRKNSPNSDGAGRRPIAKKKNKAKPASVAPPAAPAPGADDSETRLGVRTLLHNNLYAKLGMQIPEPPRP